MKDNFLDRMNAKLAETGKSGRNDLEMNDARTVEGGAVRILATYSSLYGPPSIHDINAWVSNRMGQFANQVSARFDTVQVYPENSFLTFIIEEKKLRQPYAGSAKMVRAGVGQFLDSDNRVWEVVKADEGPSYIVRKEETSIEEMLEVRKKALRGGFSPRKSVLLASIDSIPSAGGGFASADIGDIVDFYDNGSIKRGKIRSAGASGVKIASLSSGDVFTVDPAAITTIVEKGAGSHKEQDDIMRRYWSTQYPGNPEMTEIISPTSNLSVTDTRPPPSGEPIRPISVVASVGGRVSGYAKVSSFGDKQQEKVLRQTVRDPSWSLVSSGPSAREAEEILREKFGYTDRQIAKMKASVSASAKHGMLQDHKTGDDIRPATKEEEDASKEAAKSDGGVGVIEVDGQSVFVSGSTSPFAKASR